MEKLENNTVWENIRQNYSQLFAAETKVADFILGNPEKAVSANVSETAELSGVSDATVVRFCKRIGYAGFYEMKLRLSRDMGSNKSSGEEAAQLPQKQFLLMSSNLSSLSKQVDEEVLKKCAAAIDKSNTVFVIGNGYTKILACDIIYRLTRMGIRCSGGGYSETDMENLCLGKPGDVAIFFSRSGEDKKTYQEMEFAKGRGLLTVSLTDAVKCPLAQLADISLATGVERKAGYYAHNSGSSLYMMMLSEALLSYVTDKRADKNYLDQVISQERL